MSGEKPDLSKVRVMPQAAPRKVEPPPVARQSGWEGSDNQDGHFGGRGEEMIVAARR
jgi:hypothetical protein